MSPITVAITSGVISMIGWGLADIFAKKGIDKVGYHKALIYIQATGLALALPFLIFQSGGIDLSIRNLLILLIFAILDVGGYLLLYKAYEIGKVSVLNPITSTWAVLAAIVSFLFFGESFTSQKVIAFILVMVGIVFTSITSNPYPFHHHHHYRGRQNYACSTFSFVACQSYNLD